MKQWGSPGIAMKTRTTQRTTSCLVPANGWVTVNTSPWPAGEPEKPSDLDKDASREWNRICRHLRRKETLSPAYRGLIYATATGLSVFKRLLREVRAAKITPENGKGVIRSLEAMRRTYLRSMRQLQCPPAPMVLAYQPITQRIAEHEVMS